MEQQGPGPPTAATVARARQALSRDVGRGRAVPTLLKVRGAALSRALSGALQQLQPRSTALFPLQTRTVERSSAPIPEGGQEPH